MISIKTKGNVMGGYGSGRSSYSIKTTVESIKKFDIRGVRKRGHFISSSIRYKMGEDFITLKCHYRSSQGAERETVEKIVYFVKTPCNFGGYRLWLLCPSCSRRVAILYCPSRHFLCRHCCNLTYTSQQECREDRLRRKARKIRKRLGASNNLFEPILFKPKYMHQKTFDRLRKEADSASNLSLENVKKWLRKNSFSYQKG